jgi:hypothetical protein
MAVCGSSVLLDMRIEHLLLDEDAPRCSLSDDVAAKQWLLLLRLQPTIQFC